MVRRGDKRHISKKALLYLIVCAFGFSGAVHANESFLKQVTKQAYPDAHAVLAKEVEELRFERDGTHVDIDEVYLTILDEDGKRSEKVQSFYQDRNYSRLTIEVMEVLKPDGHKVPVDLKANAREETPLSDTEANIYDPSRKVLKVFLPDLEVGDTIHYRIRRETFKSVIPGHLYGMVLGQYTFPVRFYSFTLRGPVGVKVYTLVKDAVKGTYTYKHWKEEKEQIHRWVFRKVPQVTPEPSMPSFMRIVMRLLYSTLPSWQAASRWYYRLTEPKLRPTPAIIAKVEELTKGLKDNDAKLRALFYFVAQKIRYMGITAEKNRPGFEPHEVGLTFDRRYGVCRDKAALLVCMLRIAGFRANMVLVSIGSKLDKEIPVPYFNHAVAVVRDAMGRPMYYLDPTSETSKQFFPDYERDSSCLIADRKGDILRLTPPLPPDRNLFQLTVRDVLTPSGRLEGNLQAVCTGFVDTAFRYLMMVKTDEERGALLRRMFRRRYPGIVLSRVQWSDPSDRSRPFSFSFDFQIARAALKGNERITFFLPLSHMSTPGVLDRWILGKANMTNRRYPLRFGYAYVTRIIEVIHFQPPPVEIILPVFPNLESEVIDATTSFSLKEGKVLVVKREFALKQLEVSPKQYRDILMVQHARRQRAGRPIILRSAL